MHLGGPSEARRRRGAHVDQRPDQIQARPFDGKSGQVIAALLVYFEAAGTCYSYVIPVLESSIGDNGERGANAERP